MINQNQKLFRYALVIIDILIICASLFLAWYLRFETNYLGYHYSPLGLNFYMSPLLFIVPVYLFLYDRSGLYTIHRHNLTTFKEISAIIKANFIGALILITVLFVFKVMDYSRFVIFFFILFNISLNITFRFSFRSILKFIRSEGYNIKYLVIAGAGDLGIKLQKIIEGNKYLGYRIVGYLDDAYEIDDEVQNSKIIGHLSDLEDIVSNQLISYVFIAISMHHYEIIDKLVDICEKNGVKVFIVPDYYRYIAAKPYIDMIEDVPLINIRYVPLDDAFNKSIKRIFDVLFSIFILIILSPLLIITSVLIKLSSPGPIIYKQTRIGLDRKPFTMYKFRSMKVQDSDEEKIRWTCEDDPRRTEIGAFIRRYSIDELPQFYNVIKGDMSVCGPRPERPYFVEQFKETIPKYMIKHHVRPGISGLAQSRGLRGDTSIEKRIECDIFYVENWNFLLDIKIIFKTVNNIFDDENAY